jgi:hypothetical protein
MSGTALHRDPATRPSLHTYLRMAQFLPCHSGGQSTEYSPVEYDMAFEDEYLSHPKYHPHATSAVAQEAISQSKINFASATIAGSPQDSQVLPHISMSPPV